MTVFLLCLGLVLLVIGGELLVRGAVAIATALGVSPLMVGLTLVGFGTSTPELATSVQAALAGSPGVAVGNVVGSNICNILLILGMAALIRPVAATPGAFRRDGIALVAATLLCVGLLIHGEIGRLAGAALAALLVGYIVLTWAQEREAEAGGATAPTAAPVAATPAGPAAAGEPRAPLWRSGAIVAAGFALMLPGASLLVDGAIELAAGLGVSDALIGLTIVAVGTSLPELTTSVVAAVRGQGDVAFGNVVGSNIYNILGILGVTALVQPLATPPEIAAFDGWVMLAATVALVVVTVTGWRVTRGEGAALLGGYAAYLGWLTLSA
ncbi:calcium/sodium antiporter [Rubrimonas cliftonensis]|uniref:Cation:H+ antiporter n=1 Tax=Rubrimonas cliftonensis TaxID=89524 RepID=A0A1H4APH4_9RHOB|nr:calcium/sodium antiporter [Rubrimonas cliftonensis]SEA37622.1 cation:H+ antiporter [Rubrimonas cliftonensis]